MKKPKQPLMNLYYLHFRDPVTLEEVVDIFAYDDLPVVATPVFPGSFLLVSDLSYSAIKRSLSFYYEEEHAELSRPRVVMKLKGESKPEVSGLPAEDAAATTPAPDSGDP